MFFDCKGTKKTGKSQIFFHQHDIFSLFLRTFASEKQVDYAKWEHYYYISTLCNANKVLENGLVMSSLRDCRKLYQFARDNKHDYGRGIVLAQIGWLYGFMGDHEESVRQTQLRLSSATVAITRPS